MGKRMVKWATCGAFLTIAGFMMYTVGLVYSAPGVENAIDPSLEVTRDGWVIFMVANGADIAICGAILAGAGTVIVLLCSWANEKREKLSRFLAARERREAHS